MNYWLDEVDNKVYYAMVILTNIENPKAPPKMVNLATLLSDNRFKEIEKPIEYYNK